eukprot:1359864-Amorphochlora_amoeboformis.AAC.2
MFELLTPEGEDVDVLWVGCSLLSDNPGAGNRAAWMEDAIELRRLRGVEVPVWVDSWDGVLLCFGQCVGDGVAGFDGVGVVCVVVCCESAEWGLFTDKREIMESRDGPVQ